ncbi:AAA family ATPase [Nitrosarchaeum koreense]|nr:AAA family ATPase [Nitrosarchaeum koreense]
MINSITLRNFACFDDQDYTMNFSKLNIIVGPNNSGKSAFFKALNFIRFHSVNHFVFPQTWNTDYYELQDFAMSVYNHDVNRIMKIIVDYDGEPDLEANFSMKNDQIVNDYLKQGGVNIGNLKQSVHAKVASNIWYLSSVRGIIPFRTQVGSIESDKLQPLRPDCQNIIQFLLERYNDRDPNWAIFEEWLKKIDPQIQLFKTQLNSVFSSLETNRNDGQNTTNVNLNLQGSGVQSVISIIAAIIFSPPDSLIIIEEPENFQNSKTIEILVDLFNHATNNLSKQIIVITHSWDILRQYISDIGSGTPRGLHHEIAQADNFSLFTVNPQIGSEKVQKYDLDGKDWNTVISYFKELWG